MQRPKKLRRLYTAGGSVALAALIFAACGSTPATTNSTTSTVAQSQRQVGGTAYFAEAPAAQPNWIFPYVSGSYFSVANLNQFQELMYRPLYWFGQVTNPAPTYNPQLSLANSPVWSNGGKTVTITLKGWHFATCTASGCTQGQQIDAQSVIFWLNMMKAEPQYYGGYVPGLFPDNLKSYSASSPTSLSVTLNLTSTYSQNWFLYNQLSEITPLPQAWDITSLNGAAGSGGCSKVSSGAMTGASTKAACTAVWTFDTDNNGQSKSPKMAGDEGTWATNPVWQTVDGPWHLTGFDASNGRVTMAPNTAYQGPQKPYLSQFVELPYTQDTAEFAAMEAGGPGAPDLGYLPQQDVPAYSGTPGTVGPNAGPLVGKYNGAVGVPWQINYFPMNFNSNTVAGAGTNAGYLFQQLYIRQALMDGVDQTAMIRAVDKGYGMPTYGPVPILPKNQFVSSSETTNPFPFNTTAGTNLLKAHDWTIHAGGTDVCAKGGASGCGANIATGTPLSFNEIYASGTASITTIVNLETSAWSQMGIHVATKAEPFDTVIGTAQACKMTDGPKCAWEFANWGGGWIYAPDYLPTGEELFQTGAVANYGSYDNTQNNAMIHTTNVSSNLQDFYTWEDFIAKQVPVIWQPVALTYIEVIKNLGGFVNSALANINPEYWYFIKS